MKDRVLLIDDIRNLPADRTARTFDDGIEALKNEGPWDLLLLDHDYGDPDPAKTGEGIMKFLEENPQYIPGAISFVTGNPVGRERMRVIRKQLYEQHPEKRSV